MGRTRQIRPEFFKHERLAEMSPLHRLLFIALLTQADREGRLEDRPMRLKIECLPYDDCDLVDMLDDLAIHPDRPIVRYEVEGRAYIQITSFTRWQSPHPKEEASRIPEIPRTSMHEPCMDDASGMHEGCISDACLMLRYKNKKEKNKNKNKDKKEKSAGARARVTDLVPLSTFDAFYAVYPRKKHRKEALAAWERHVTLDMVPHVLERLRFQIENDPDWAREGGRFIPYPATWINGHCWNDEIEIAAPAEKPVMHRNDALELSYLRRRNSLPKVFDSDDDNETSDDDAVVVA